MSRLLLLAVLSLLFASALLARPTYTGYSGAPGATGTCASSCHGSGGGTVQVTGFPTEYVPDSTYNVSAEHNGVHLSSSNRTSGTFSWTAPTAGTGSVRLYVGAHQGTSMSGANTNIVMTAAEAVIEAPPEITSTPNPADNAADVPVTTTLSWSGGDGATSFDVYLGPSEPLDFMGTTSGFTFDIPIELLTETTYMWQVNASNDFGTTAGQVWSFTTEAEQLPLPGQATNPIPANGATEVPVTLSTLQWDAADFAEEYWVSIYASDTFDVGGPFTTTFVDLPFELEYSTTYHWFVTAVNASGTMPSELWSFTTEAFNAAHDELIASEFSVSPAYPNPFNSTVRITLAVPTESPVTARVYNRTGQLVTTLLDNSRIGNSTIEWNAQGVAAGTYFLKCDCAGYSTTQKLIYLP
ncbi:MAG: T9SS type A sorting domain-containing protein [Calditrichaeota bacterium]|nr:T9SS type A sorting domain-containing protein [Calditrichota bacterium]MCB9369956.1 T9SS type A sorting domain-containing protein [Calditrichota bacterium]